MRPAGLADVVDWIEEEQLLQVVKSLEDRSSPLLDGNPWEVTDLYTFSYLNQQPFGAEPFNETVDVYLQRRIISKMTFQPFDDPGDGEPVP